MPPVPKRKKGEKDASELAHDVFRANRGEEVGALVGKLHDIIIELSDQYGISVSVKIEDEARPYKQYLTCTN